MFRRGGARCSTEGGTHAESAAATQMGVLSACYSAPVAMHGAEEGTSTRGQQTLAWDASRDSSHVHCQQAPHRACMHAPSAGSQRCAHPPQRLEHACGVRVLSTCAGCCLDCRKGHKDLEGGVQGEPCEQRGRGTSLPAVCGNHCALRTLWCTARLTLQRACSVRTRKLSTCMEATSSPCLQICLQHSWQLLV
jgi:hypothetical protein